MCLYSSGQYTIIPEEIVEDVLVRIDYFVFPVDFIVVNMKDNKKILLILGTPFSSTGRAILDVHERQFMLRVGEERVVFKIKEAVEAPREESTMYSDFKADVLKELAEEGIMISVGCTRRSQRRKSRHGRVHWVRRAK